jgi:hypothetical protein
MSEYYIISSKLSSSTFQVMAVDETLDYLNMIVGEYSGIKFPIVFKQKYGKKLHDVLDTGFPSFYLISNRFLNILQENKITGWKTFPIIIKDKENIEVDGYSGFSITGVCGNIDYKKSIQFTKRFVPNGPDVKCLRGIYPNFSKWDGSDFFIPKDSLYIIVTNRTRLLLKDNKISNIQFTNILEDEFSYSDVEKYI